MRDDSAEWSRLMVRKGFMAVLASYGCGARTGSGWLWQMLMDWGGVESGQGKNKE